MKGFKGDPVDIFSASGYFVVDVALHLMYERHSDLLAGNRLCLADDNENSARVSVPVIRLFFFGYMCHKCKRKFPMPECQPVDISNNLGM